MKTKESLGCLTEKMKKFLKMSQKQRDKHFSKNYQSKLYERIRKNIEYSFIDVEFGFEYLPKKQKDRISLMKIQGYLLKTILDDIENQKLREYCKDKFIEFLSLLDIINSDKKRELD